ncbi:hypothetical protein ACLKA6_010501 [Drosophila palustris]
MWEAFRTLEDFSEDCLEPVYGSISSMLQVRRCYTIGTWRFKRFESVNRPLDIMYTKKRWILKTLDEPIDPRMFKSDYCFGDDDPAYDMSDPDISIDDLSCSSSSSDDSW